jgi:dephospho-CoA kinase
MKLIGITGGIGAGKSTVTDYLKAKGLTVLDADLVAREIVEPGSEALGLLADAFGMVILNEDGSLNRRKLAEIVFANPAKKGLLDEITHKKVIEIMLERANSMRDQQVVFLDVPLLFESGMDKYVDSVWLVDADDETRVQRVVERDGITEDHVIKRMSYQMDREEKIRRSHVILCNNGVKDELYRQIEVLINNI